MGRHYLIEDLPENVQRALAEFGAGCAPQSEDADPEPGDRGDGEPLG